MKISVVVSVLTAIVLGCPGVSRADLVLSVDGACPGEITIQWTGATADKQAGLWFSRNLGEYRLNGPPCAGTTLGLGTHGLRLARVFRSGGQGEGQMTGRVPILACSGYLQMIVSDGYPCSTSNVAQIP